MRRLCCIFLTVAWMALGCVTSGSGSGKPPAQTRKDDRAKIDKELSQEMSLKSDREDLKEERKDIPSDKQKSNDELALFLQLTKDGKEPPQTARDKFNSLVQKRRSEFRQKVDRLRSDYSSGETRRREDFMNDQRRRRDSYFSEKHDYKDNSRFTADLDRDRTRFFADERDRRSAFEAELNSRSRDFESYMREREAEFNEQVRLYADKQKAEMPKDKKGGVTVDQFKQMDRMPMEPLGTD